MQDKGGRRMALRPEFTPSLARMVLQKGKGLPLPVKWFTLAQCWRFERSTRGRRREHYQWNMDCIGELRLFCTLCYVCQLSVTWYVAALFGRYTVVSIAAEHVQFGC